MIIYPEIRLQAFCGTTNYIDVSTKLDPENACYHCKHKQNIVTSLY
jgi:hypothetical protein